MVAQINKLEESKLENFLFSASRAGAAKLCEPLRELQENRCFYCHQYIGNSGKLKPEVDHFIPWARYPNDSLANYVVSHSICNANKKDYLAGNAHVENWVKRISGNNSYLSDLDFIAKQNNWYLGETEMKGVVSTIYQHTLPEVELWKLGKEFELIDKPYLSELFSIM